MKHKKNSSINQKLTYRKGVFIVAYRVDERTAKPEYVLLKRIKHWSGWEFPKGGIEEGENPFQAVRRETYEETGIQPFKIKALNITGKYRYDKLYKDRPGRIGQSYTLFSAEVRGGRATVDRSEHSGHIWLPFEEAVKKLTWPNQKKCLKVVDKQITKDAKTK